MHRPTVLSIVLAASLASTIAFAAKDKATANFESLSASGITGTADLAVTPQGQTKIHEQLRGLTPGVTYVSFVYQGNASCGSAVTPTQIVQFTANPAGNATVNGNVAIALDQVGSISVQRMSDDALLACGAVQ